MKMSQEQFDNALIAIWDAKINIEDDCQLRVLAAISLALHISEERLWDLKRPQIKRLISGLDRSGRSSLRKVAQSEHISPSFEKLKQSIQQD
jgi:hypothetical protein